MAGDSISAYFAHYTFGDSCPPDFNCDHIIDLFDYLDFVAAFAEGSLAADFNHDNTVDFFDYLDFLQALAAGCEI